MGNFELTCLFLVAFCSLSTNPCLSVSVTEWRINEIFPALSLKIGVFSIFTKFSFRPISFTGKSIRTFSFKAFLTFSSVSRKKYSDLFLRRIFGRFSLVWRKNQFRAVSKKDFWRFSFGLQWFHIKFLLDCFRLSLKIVRRKFPKFALVSRKKSFRRSEPFFLNFH